MHEFRAGITEHLEFDMDTRLYGLMYEAIQQGLNNEGLISVPDVKSLVVRSHWQGEGDARNEDTPHLLYVEHGFTFPQPLPEGVPLHWLNPYYVPPDEELIEYYEKKLKRKLADSDFEETAAYMRFAYGEGHAISCVREESRIGS